MLAIAVRQYRSNSMDKQRIQLSKFLSYILRHRPDEIGLQVDTQGWAQVDDLIAGCVAHGRSVTREDLDDVVAHNTKKRLEYSEDGSRIRASQGHSIEIDLAYEPQTPPNVLYHGTATKNLDSIRREGLRKGNRHHVHLSSDETTAREVGARHGEAVVLVIRAREMSDKGHVYYLSTNRVWLTEHVPATYIDNIIESR